MEKVATRRTAAASLRSTRAHPSAVALPPLSSLQSRRVLGLSNPTQHLALPTVSVITFNLEDDCDAYDMSQVVELIAHSGAQFALLQETNKSAVRIAEQLGWHCVQFDTSHTAIISLFPLTRILEGKHFGMARAGSLHLCVIHFDDYPYIAFEAAGINYPVDCGETCVHSDDRIALQNRSLNKRRPDFDELRAAISSLPRDSMIIAGGDFNEPSHRDWTLDVVKRGLAPFSIIFPTTAVIERLGFVDSYRYVHPDPVEDPGLTWPDRDPGYEHRRDRIDFIFATKNLRPIASDMIATQLSDHSAVRSEFELPKEQHGRLPVS